MDLLALISFLVAMLIFAITGLAPSPRHPYVNVATGLLFVCLAMVLAAFGLTHPV